MCKSKAMSKLIYVWLQQCELDKPADYHSNRLFTVKTLFHFLAELLRRDSNTKTEFGITKNLTLIDTHYLTNLPKPY